METVKKSLVSIGILQGTGSGQTKHLLALGIALESLPLHVQTRVSEK